MPKWLIYLFALAALVGVIFLEQTREPFPPAKEGASVVTPPVVAPTTTLPAPRTERTPAVPGSEAAAPAVVPSAPQPAPGATSTLTAPEREVAPPQTRSEVLPAPQTPPRTARPDPAMLLQTPSAALAPASGTAQQTPSSTRTERTPRVDSRWAGLSLDDFLAQAAGDLVRLSPETVTYLGIGPALRMRDDHLDPLTRDWEDEYYSLEQAIVDHLATYDLAREAAGDRLNAEIYRASLLNELAGRAYTDNAYSVSSYMDSYPTYIEWFMTSLHPLETFDNAVDYVARLFELPTRFRELEERLADSEALDAVPPRFMLEKAVEQIRETAATPARETGLYTTLESALPQMEDADAADAQALLEWVATTLETNVLPSYAKLADFVADMAGHATNDAGVWKQVEGNEYYAYCLQSQTTTDLTAAEIYDLGVAEVERIQGEIRKAAAELGLDAALSIPELFARLSETTGSSLGEDTIARCQAIIDDIGPRVASAFLRMPTSSLVVVDGGYDTYFSAGTLDGSRPGQFFMPTLAPQPIYGLPTVTYHEAVPGHGFQAAYAYEADLPDYIAGLSFTAFDEGWALYAERLAWEEGAYDENPYGNLGRLQDELFRAVRLVVDPGLHAKRWTYEQAVEYMVANTGLDEPYVRSEVERYIVTPGQAVTYKIGMLKLLELRERARAALGSAFSLPEFHDVVLGHGALPLDLLEREVDAYIARTPEEVSPPPAP